MLSCQIKDFLSPMLATAGSNIPTASAYDYEVKWDGIRATFIVDKGLTTIYNGIITKFPEITSRVKSIEAELAILDGEIVFLDEEETSGF